MPPTTFMALAIAAALVCVNLFDSHHMIATAATP